MSARFKVSRKHGTGKVEPLPPKYSMLQRSRIMLNTWEQYVGAAKSPWKNKANRRYSISSSEWWAAYCLKMQVWDMVKEKRK